MIVVVRYFGGTLLGVSGLINAYRAASKNAIENAHLIEKTVEDILLIDFSYKSMNEVMKVFKDEQLPQLKTIFDMQCSIKTSVRLNDSKRIQDLLGKIEGVVVRKLHV